MTRWGSQVRALYRPLSTTRRRYALYAILIGLGGQTTQVFLAVPSSPALPPLTVRGAASHEIAGVKVSHHDAELLRLEAGFDAVAQERTNVAALDVAERVACHWVWCHGARHGLLVGTASLLKLQ